MPNALSSTHKLVKAPKICTITLNLATKFSNQDYLQIMPMAANLGLLVAALLAGAAVLTSFALHKIDEGEL